MNTDIHELIDSVSEQVEKFTRNMDQASPKDLGLDRRASFDNLFVNDDCIIVDKGSDQSLQYYGGFEYVDKEFRFEMGDYVIYLANDQRVREHISRYFETVDA